jgi:hypothetical protein
MVHSVHTANVANGSYMYVIVRVLHTGTAIAVTRVVQMGHWPNAQYIWGRKIKKQKFKIYIIYSVIYIYI